MLFENISIVNGPNSNEPENVTKASAPWPVGVVDGTGVGVGVGVAFVGSDVGVGVGLGVDDGISEVGVPPTPLADPPPPHDASEMARRKAPTPTWRRDSRIIGNLCWGGLWEVPAHRHARIAEEVECLMVDVLARNWWVLLVRGLVAIAFGIATFLLPGIALFALILAFGIWAALDGAFALVAAFGPNVHHRWVLILEGIVGLGAGFVAFRYPGLTGLTLLLLIAWWAVVTGVLEIVAAIQLRKQIVDEWWMILAGALSIVFGVLLLINPGSGALAVLWIVGFYAILFGVALVLLSFRLRKHRTAHAAA
jgi:uncharacterized membrane protein HdeD (DUF308 family)